MSSCAFRHPAGNAANETKALLELATGSIEIVTCPPERLMLLPTTREAGWELAFARGRGLSFTGYAYETVLHEMAAATSDACITRIELALAGGTGCQDGGSMV